MSKNLEYAIMIFLISILVILFRWSENGRYNSYIVSGRAFMLDTRSGDLWGLAKDLNNKEKWVQFPSIHE